MSGSAPHNADGSDAIQMCLRQFRRLSLLAAAVLQAKVREVLPWIRHMSMVHFF